MREQVSEPPQHVPAREPPDRVDRALREINAAEGRVSMDDAARYAGEIEQAHRDVRGVYESAIPGSEVHFPLRIEEVGIFRGENLVASPEVGIAKQEVRARAGRVPGQ